MKRKRQVTDLFGDDQMNLFGDAPDRIPHHKQKTYTPDPDSIRQRLNEVLEKARAAPETPWPVKKQRVWSIVFPNMAKWLPDDEANQLCFAFEREMERLNLAA